MELEGVKGGLYCSGDTTEDEGQKWQKSATLCLVAAHLAQSLPSSLSLYHLPCIFPGLPPRSPPSV
jgi:hypothetical protein